MDHEGYSELVTKDAHDHAVTVLLRRRPDLNAWAKGDVKIPPEERAQFELDKLAYLHDAVDRLVTDMSASVLAARRSGASWGRVGLAINESAQTTFNRYRKLEAPSLAPSARKPKKDVPVTPANRQTPRVSRRRTKT